LDGEYKWYDEKGRLRFIHSLNKGEYVSYKEFYPSGTIHQQFDYTKLWDNEPHTWCIYIYDKKGNLTTTTYMRKDKNGRWPSTRG